MASFARTPTLTMNQILLLVIGLGIFLGLLVGFYYSSSFGAATPAPGYMLAPMASTPLNMSSCSKCQQL
jgi:hypothetical protein